MASFAALNMRAGGYRSETPSDPVVPRGSEKPAWKGKEGTAANLRGKIVSMGCLRSRFRFQSLPLAMKLAASHLKRYKEIIGLLWKYGRSDLVEHLNAGEGFDAKETTPTEKAGGASPEQLADDLEAMGPTYVKLGQVLAGRPDLLPDAYLKALARLQDRVKPFPYEEAEQIVMTELGVRISKAFSRFDIEPLAAASLGQVHFAELRDGRPFQHLRAVGDGAGRAVAGGAGAVRPAAR